MYIDFFKTVLVVLSVMYITNIFNNEINVCCF